MSTGFNLAYPFGFGNLTTPLLWRLWVSDGAGPLTNFRRMDMGDLEELGKTDNVSTVCEELAIFFPKLKKHYNISAVI
ncbi:hypothetical protein MANES_01G203250v8 [Manihot esculenta]|uniref:Uncharacterized protein n=1 Tax=Manihot esculenta TaxID=3983 RepID=A0ACB7IES3_MANES|nr:hypothetical protein MANES_01G203250v8 [Manihot esculenta]